MRSWCDWEGLAGTAMPLFSGTGPFVSSLYQIILWEALFRSCELPCTSCCGLNLSPASPFLAMTRIHSISFADVWQKRILLPCSWASLRVTNVICLGRGQGGWRRTAASRGCQQGSRLSFPAWTWVPAKGQNLQLQPLPASCFFLGRRAQCSLVNHFQPHPSTNCLVTKALIIRLLRF